MTLAKTIGFSWRPSCASHDLDDLLQRTDAAGQRDEGIGALEHGVFARMHVRGYNEFVQLTERVASRFHIDQEFGNDARDLTAA